MPMNTDRIEQTLILRAPRTRVWRALTNATEFGAWFNCELVGGFTPGACIQGRITISGYEHVAMELAIEQIVPERLFSYRWHPYAVEPGIDYSTEPTTLVEFHIAEIAGGTKVTVVESGFDHLPPARRTEAFRMNEQGWAGQLTNIERYVTA
ncbi:MAG: SRPBCC family protein [Dehalococcoidia bacterium]